MGLSRLNVLDAPYIGLQSSISTPENNKELANISE
jgi:hypothetical protein